MNLLNGTAIARKGRAILLCGPSGSGKSSLALAAIGQGWALVADDIVEIDAAMIVAPPLRLAGVLEVRGIGLMRMPWRVGAKLVARVDLTPAANIERLPDLPIESGNERALPAYEIDPRGPASVERLNLILSARRAA